MSEENPISKSDRYKAALVHLLTASGAFVALLALAALHLDRPRDVLLLLLAALVIDGIDGPLARRYRVGEALPGIDGATLDLIIDFLTYVLIPVLYLLQYQLLPAGWNWAGASAILLSSLYLFVNTDMKSEDNYFNGFPAAWNLVLVFWVLAGTGSLFNVITAFGLSILSVVPVKSVHPVRVEKARMFNISLAVLWVLLSALLLLDPTGPGTGEISLPWLLWLAVTLWFPGFSLLRTFRR